MSTISIQIHVEETGYQAPSQWRMMGARGKAEHVRKLCERNDVRVGRILEIGAGDGSILRCLGEAGFCGEMHAVEISASGVAVILAQNIPGLASCQTFNGYEVPFEDNYFDLVVLSHVLEHVEFERALLREIRRVSRYQVIEIPMDFMGLRDEVYHLVGPSYGHINAHSPDSLRFLLSQERLRILDEILGPYPLELREYDHFVNNGHERTPRAVEEFRKRYDEAQKQVLSLPRAAQESRASVYAVLTREETAAELLARAMKGIKSSIKSGQVQAARLIFAHYIAKDQAVAAAMEIAGEFARSKPSVALEYLDRVLAIEAGNAAAAAERARLAAVIAAQPRAADPAPSAAPAGAESGLRQFVKDHFPLLVRVVRRIRR